MIDNQVRLEPPDLSHYNDGRADFPLEELGKYMGQTLAWSPDGTRILASGDCTDAVIEKLAALGIPPIQVVWEDMPSVGESGIL